MGPVSLNTVWTKTATTTAGREPSPAEGRGLPEHIRRGPNKQTHRSTRLGSAVSYEAVLQT